MKSEEIKFVYAVSSCYTWDGEDCYGPTEAIFISENDAKEYCKFRGYHGMGQYKASIKKLKIHKNLDFLKIISKLDQLKNSNKL